MTRSTSSGRAGARKVCRGNLRPAPFSITPAIVRGVIGLTNRAAHTVQVPVLPVRLVDRPRPSEDPTRPSTWSEQRTASANDERPPARPRKLDLNAVPSAMEQLAASWRKERADG